MTDDDPFADSDPDPAPTFPDVDSHFAEVGEGTLVTDDVSCEGCVHAEVCVYREQFAGMLQERSSPPLDPNDLAAICDAFEPDEE